MVSTTKAVGLAVVVLFIAFAFPTFISGAEQSNATVSKTISGGVNESAKFEDAILVSITGKTSNTVDLAVTSLVTGNNTTVTLQETETMNIQLDNQTVTVSALDIQAGTNGDVTVRLGYPNNFAWEDGAIRISQNLPVVLAALALIIMAGVMAAMVRT